MLSHIFRVLSEASINVEEMENVLYDGTHAACARIRLDDTPTDDQVQTIREGENVLSVALRVRT